MPHHVGEGSAAGPAHGEDRALGFTHRRQLGRIPHEHQPGAVGMGAAQADLQQLAIHHRGLIHQHQIQVLQGLGRLTRFLAPLQVSLPLQLQPQQPVDRGGVPGGPQPLPFEVVAQHPQGLVGGGHHRPTEAGRFRVSQKPHRKEGFAGTGVATQHEGLTVGRVPPSQAAKAGGGGLLVGGEGRAGGDRRRDRLNPPPAPASGPDAAEIPPGPGRAGPRPGRSGCPPGPPGGCARGFP